MLKGKFTIRVFFAAEGVLLTGTLVAAVWLSRAEDWRPLLLVALLLTAATATACMATPGGRLYVRVGPPTPIVEARIVAPGDAGTAAFSGASQADLRGPQQILAQAAGTLERPQH